MLLASTAHVNVSTNILFIQKDISEVAQELFTKHVASTSELFAVVSLHDFKLPYADASEQTRNVGWQF